MAMAQFARVCAITDLAFPKKYAIESSTISSLLRRKDWGWALGLCVRSSNRMAARSQPRMLRAEVRGSILFCQQAPQRDGPSIRLLGFHCSSSRGFLLLFSHRARSRNRAFAFRVGLAWRELVVTKTSHQKALLSAG